jgi:hypothetical protein
MQVPQKIKIKKITGLWNLKKVVSVTVMARIKFLSRKIQKFK